MRITDPNLPEPYDSFKISCSADDIDPKDLMKCPRCGLSQEIPICCPKCGWCDYGAELGCPECVSRDLAEGRPCEMCEFTCIGEHACHCSCHRMEEGNLAA